MRGLVVVAALLVAPMLGGLGSNNPALVQRGVESRASGSRHRSPCARSRIPEHGRLLVHGLAFAFAALIAFTAFDGTWRHPYRQVPLAAATVHLGLSGPLHGLSTDGNTASFLLQLRAATDAVAAAEPTVLVVWAGYQPYTAYGLPGASVASGLSQPLFAWLSAPYFADKSLAAACEDHSRAILLLEYPGQRADLTTNPVLTTACAGRQWTPRESIDGLRTALRRTVAARSDRFARSAACDHLVKSVLPSTHCGPTRVSGPTKISGTTSRTVGPPAGNSCVMVFAIARRVGEAVERVHVVRLMQPRRVDTAHE